MPFFSNSASILARRGPLMPTSYASWVEVINKAYLLNLDTPSRFYLTGMYASDQGKPATDPTDILRPLVVMSDRGEKMAPKHPGVIKRLVDRALQERTFERRPERLIQELFARGFVVQSVEKGLIPKNLLVLKDGAPMRTGASSSGAKVYKCRGKEIYRLRLSAALLRS